MSDNFDDFDFEFDDYEEDDYQEDITESYEGDEDDGQRPALSRDEQDSRVRDYLETAENKMSVIVKSKQYDAKERAEALRWLGESGYPEAIPQILKVYNKDQTPGMKQEAAYVLGQYKALGQAYDDPEIELQTEERINNIILYDERGKRASATPFIIAEVGLVILALVLFGLGFVFMNTVAATRADARATSQVETQAALPTATTDSEDVVQAQIGDYYQQLLNDGAALQIQLVTSSRGDSIDCEANIVNPAPYQLSPNWAESNYTALVNAINDVRANLQPVYSGYETACAEFRPINEPLVLGETLIEAQSTLNSFSFDLSALGIQFEAPVLATPTPRPTTTAIDPEVLNTVVAELETLTNDMTGIGGATAVMIFNWQQVIDSGEIYRSGCNQPEPIIPTDYVLAEDVASAVPQLVQIVANINLGLAQTRDASTAFFTMCTEGEIPTNASARLAQATNAETAFDTAQNNLSIIGN